MFYSPAKPQGETASELLDGHPAPGGDSSLQGRQGKDNIAELPPQILHVPGAIMLCPT